MFVLQVELKPKAGSQKALERAYANVFRPAISAQNGFATVALLRPVEGCDDYRLGIAFQDRGSQQEWVATDLHQEVWQQIESHCVEYSVKYYNTV